MTATRANHLPWVNNRSTAARNEPAGAGDVFRVAPTSPNRNRRSRRDGFRAIQTPTTPQNAGSYAKKTGPNGGLGAPSDAHLADALTVEPHMAVGSAAP